MIRSSNSSFGRSLSRKIDRLDSRMDQIYSTTYATRPDNKNDLNQISGEINGMLDSIIGDSSASKISDITKLYVRLQKKNGVGNDNFIQSTLELFSNNSIVNSLAMNTDVMRSIMAEDYQYDMMCKYMPKLEDALDIKKDNTLSSDNFTKEFATVKSIKTDASQNAEFFQRVKNIKKKYMLDDFYEEMYRKASKYGECFVYCVPYNVAIQRLMDRRGYLRSKGIMESAASEVQPHVIMESSSASDKELINGFLKNNSSMISDDFKVQLRFNNLGILSESVEQYKKANELLLESANASLTEAYLVLKENSVQNEANNEPDKNKGLDSLFDKKSTKKSMRSIASDGLILPNSFKTSSADKIKDLNGAVLELIPRKNMLPIYITDNMCAGYYHFNFHMEEISCANGQSAMNAMSHTYMGGNYDQDYGVDEMIGYIAQQISQQIDAQFINANKDLKEEIYAILKYNDSFNVVGGCNDITVTFIPAEDILHFYFEMDKDTHRGISDLKKATVPAMCYCMLYLTDTIGQVTRAQDKRIYYVKQNVETNVARTMQNVINQIKKGNMGMRQISSMNSILSIVGRYNDHVIPVGPSGDPPVQFEVMNGQDLKTPTELMERFEDQAVSSTDVPLEFVQTVNQVDYATRFTMSNSKFLRKIYKRQRICQDAFSIIFTKVYNYEYGENEKEIRIMLPAPAFLSMTNSQQLIQNTTSYISAITDVELADEDDEVKSIFTKKMMKIHLGSYLDYDQIDELIRVSKLEAAIEKDSENQDTE